MKKTNRRMAWLATLILVGAMLASIPISQARADTSQLMTLDPTSLAATLVSQSVISGQDVVTNWTDASGDTLTLAGPAGSVLTIGTVSETEPPGISTTPTYFEVSPPVINTSAITGDQAIAQYETSGLSLYQDALAVGFSTTDAQEMVNENNDGKIIGHICANWFWNGIAHSRECVVQHLLQSNGSKDWYIGDRTESSVEPDPYGYVPLEAFRTYVTYNKHDDIQWDPEATITESDCTSVTLSAGYNGTGVSITNNICPQTLTPFFPPIDGFGAKWENTDGVYPNPNHAGGPWEADPSVSVEYDAGGANTDNYSLWARPWYYNTECS